MEKYHIIAHHGVKGQRWGVRRFQNKDGSLTSLGMKRFKKQEKDKINKEKAKIKKEKQDLKDQKAKAKQAEKDQKAKAKEFEKVKKEIETIEQKRARLLKSSDPKELFENRHLLTTDELRERMTRIGEEQRLASIAKGSEKTGVQKFAEKADKIVTVGNKLSSIYQLKDTALGRDVLKLFGVGKDKPESGIDIDTITKGDLDKMSMAKMKDFAAYMQNRQTAQNILDKMRGKTDTNTKNKTETENKNKIKAFEDPDKHNGVANPFMNEKPRFFSNSNKKTSGTKNKQKEREPDEEEDTKTKSKTTSKTVTDYDIVTPSYPVSVKTSGGTKKSTIYLDPDQWTTISSYPSSRTSGSTSVLSSPAISGLLSSPMPSGSSSNSATANTIAIGASYIAGLLEARKD